MIVIASKNGVVGIREAMEALKAGGSAVDAVEAGIRLVEANPQDHSVGIGGFPDLLGQVALDAAIMEGRGLRAGAVGALQDYLHPISVARKVMERLPHVFLVGAGAERFAAEMGFERLDLLTPESWQVWTDGLQDYLSEGGVGEFKARTDLWELVRIATDPERTRGTVNLIARDSEGRMAVGVSTSGWAWRYPGRLGDSPVIGAGLYADNRYGAVACTGMGEMAIRAGTARSVVLYLKMGLSLAEAGRQAMLDLNDLGGPYLSEMNFILLDREGRHAGFSNAQDKSYLFMTDGMGEPEEAPRAYVPTRRQWGEDGG